MSKNLTLAMPIILTASVITMSASMTTSRAADECLSGPKGTAPAGSHWYYRVERSTGRHCWYLGAEGQKVRSVSERTSKQTRKRVEQHSRNSQPAAQPAETRPSLPPSAPPVPDSKAATSFFQQYWSSLFGRAEPPQIAPSAEAPQTRQQAEPLRITPPVEPLQTAQTAEAPRLAVPADASRPTVASAASNFAQEQDQVGAQEDMPPVWPVLTAAQTKAAAGPGLSYQYMIAILVGALALAGILMALVYRLASIRVDRQRRQPERARWDPETRTMLPMPPLGDTNAFPRSGTPARRLLLPSPLLPKSEPELDREPAHRLPLPKLPFELGRELYEPVRPKLSTKLLPHELAREARKPVLPQRPPELDREARKPVLPQRPPELDREARKPILPKRPPELDRGSREPHEARRLRELRELREGLETRLEQLRDARRRSAA
jgi:hypothetical protein